ncbi:hypothetical protein NLJ89_g6942 [Agrocybe chaxingu]|uniref:acylaminoacyl-peptidase n=1 Tax=Agrocybe chaxingu TaxID=84603 RepID=A0A9W8MU63_9AGAR|nr:hypothetical protein NLJ89_g6942 [Agrocybe chaxingu]
MYTQLAEIPVPTGVQFARNGGNGDAQKSITIQVSYSARDHVRNTKRTLARSFVISDTITSTILQDTPDVVAQITSDSGKTRAVLRAVKSDKGTIRYVEVWADGYLQASLDVTDQHGDFYADEFLGSLAIAPSETALVYVAEGKVPDEENKDPFRKFKFAPDFGEGLTGKRRPRIFILRWDTPTKPSLLQLSTDDAPDVRFGQPVFSPDSDNVIYATGYEFTHDGRILGIKGCFNRPSGIWQLRLPAEALSGDDDKTLTALCRKLTPPHLSCRSPRTFILDGKSSLVWLSAASGGAHLATSNLHLLDISSSANLDLLSGDKPLVGFSDKPLSDLKLFPGLYSAYNLPTSPFVDSSILVHSQWGPHTTVLRISSKDGAVRDLTPDADGSLFSWTVLGTDGRSNVVCSRSSPSVPYELVLGALGSSEEVAWISLEKPKLPEYISSALSSIQTSVVPIPGHHLVETILIRPAKAKPEGEVLPCITSPHGGPHGASSTAFSAYLTALVLEGYTVSLPNYTGSPGYGEAFLQGLIGRCGELDVEECIASARHLVKLGISEEGPGKQLVMGGSHGGFLTAHLIGKYPDFFSAAVLRNPVISVGEISSTDIPDWYFSEFGVSYPVSSSLRPGIDTANVLTPPPLMSLEIFERLQAASPTTYIDSVRVPVLLLIGKSDRRVAPSHGIAYYHALKARYAGKEKEGRKVELLAFDGEGHPIDGVEAAKVVFEATRDWFAQAWKIL